MNRIQHQRGKPLPPGAKCVTRISRWGNHKYKMIEHGGPYTREEAVALYRADLVAMTPDARRKWLEPLKGATALACCKPGLLCHADVLIEFLNESLYSDSPVRRNDGFSRPTAARTAPVGCATLSQTALDP